MPFCKVRVLKLTKIERPRVGLKWFKEKLLFSKRTKNKMAPQFRD